MNTNIDSYPDIEKKSLGVKLSSIISLLEEWSSSIFLGASTLLMFYEVVARYFFKLPTYWAEEWSPFLVVWGLLIGSSILIRQSGHISVDLLPKALSERNRLCLDTYIHLLILAFSLVFIFSSTGMLKDAYIGQTLSKSLLQTPMYIVYAMLPVAIGLMIIRTIERLYSNVKNLVKIPRWYLSSINILLVGITILFYFVLASKVSALVTLAVLLFPLLLMGVPVSFALGISSVVVIMQFNMIPVTGIASKMFWSINKHSLLAIPYFILSGNIMTKGKLAEYLLTFISGFLKWIHGGLGIAIMFASAFFGAITGVSAASAAAIGTMALPELQKKGYPKKFGAGLIAAGGTLAIVIPPSNILVVYGAVAEQSITDMFKAGIVPGLLIAAVLSAYAYFTAKTKDYDRREPDISWSDMFKKFKTAIWALLMPVFILGSIYTGIATPTEAASVSCIYAVVACIFIYRDVSFKDMIEILTESVKLSGMIYAISMTACLFGFIISMEQLPNLILQTAISMDMNWWQFMLIVNVIVFGMGCFLGPVSIIMIVVPIVLPVAKGLGINPMHLGILMTINMELALLTPPVGTNLYVLSRVSKLPVTDVILGSLPFITILFVFLMLITFIPALSLVFV